MAMQSEEPLPVAQLDAFGAVLAAIANGTLQPPAEGKLWQSADMVALPWRKPEPAPAPPAPMTVQQILAAGRAAGLGRRSSHG